MARPQFSFPAGGLPNQTQIMTDRAVFTEAYAVIPKGVMTDIVTSNLPHWEETRAWIIARPMSGFSETFSHYLVEVAAGGGSEYPELDRAVQSVIFVAKGEVTIVCSGRPYVLGSGGYAYLPPETDFQILNASNKAAGFHWIRKRYQPVEGIGVPEPFFTNYDKADHISMPFTNNAWVTSRFVDPDDMRHDFHVNIVSFLPGGNIPFAETHVMEHGLYVLEGKAVYRLNKDWVEVEAGDYMWLRAFCPQACVAAGPGPFRYLLYKDVNRHPDLGSFQK